MAKPRDHVYTATRELDIATLMASPHQIMLATILTAIQESMSEVAASMIRDGARPNPGVLPTLTLIFESHGGEHHGLQDRQGH